MGLMCLSLPCVFRCYHEETVIFRDTFHTTSVGYINPLVWYRTVSARVIKSILLVDSKLLLLSKHDLLSEIVYFTFLL